MDVAASLDRSLTFVYFHRNLELTWNYAEAHHFKGPHDDIKGAIKRSVYSVTAQKVFIQNASHFCSYASSISHVSNMIYLDKSGVQIPDVNDSSYVPALELLKFTKLKG